MLLFHPRHLLGPRPLAKCLKIHPCKVKLLNKNLTLGFEGGVQQHSTCQLGSLGGFSNLCDPNG